MTKYDDADDRVDAVEALPREMTPPAGLEDRLVSGLRERGLVARGRSPRLLRAALYVIALGGAFGAGWMLRPASGDLPGSQDEPRFVLLLYGSVERGSGDDTVREYADWARRLARSGVRVSGEKLSDVEVLVRQTQAGSQPGDRLRGFFIVQATDERHARVLAESHPHVRRGGTIVVRRIEPT